MSSQRALRGACVGPAGCAAPNRTLGGKSEVLGLAVASNATRTCTGCSGCPMFSARIESRYHLRTSGVSEECSVEYLRKHGLVQVLSSLT